jgi:hypothetical protein
MPGNGRRELAATWEHYRFAPDGSYGTAQGAVVHELWVSIFSYFFSSLLLVYYCVSYCIFCFAVTFSVA